MIDLSELSINIPVKIDSQDRFDNLVILLNYFKQCFICNITICECNKEKSTKLLDICEKFKTKYIFLENPNEYILKTKTFNTLCKNTETSIILNCDTDAFIPNTQIIECYNLIKNNQFDMCYPYDGHFYNVRLHNTQTVIDSGYDFSLYTKDKLEWWNDHAIGGCVMWNKEKYIESGMENENFVGWGFEDDERVTRSRILGLRIGRVNGSLFHLNHDRSSINYSMKDITTNNQRLFNEISRMSKDQLKNTIKNWNWCK